MSKQTEALKLAFKALIFTPDPSEENMQAVMAIREALAEQPAQQQEPVACQHNRYSVDVQEQTGYCIDCGAEGRMRFVVGDTPPASKPWVGLTEMDVGDFKGGYQSGRIGSFVGLVAAIEAKLKEKNT